MTRNLNKPVPLSRKEMLPLPAISGALGMAASYYTYPLFAPLKHGQYLLLGLFFLFVVVINLLRAVKFFRWEKDAFVYIAGILAVASAAGFALGVGSRRTVLDTPAMGLSGDRITAVSGKLLEDPRTLQRGSGMGILELRQCGADGGLRASARGKVTLFFPAESIPRVKEFGRGSEIYAEGFLVNSPGGGRFPMFRAVSVHVTKGAPPLEQMRTGFRMTILEKFQGRQNSPVWGALASALLLGVRDDLDTELTEGFRNSGCTHILALSGMHLAILSGLLALLLKRPLGVRLSSLLGAVFVIFYVFVAGSQPSLVRAGIMYLIGTIGVWGFLKGKPLSLLCMAFIIQILFQSETGTSISFMLSYLALAGIFSLGGALRDIFRGRLPGFINAGLSASLGAFVLTAPVVVYYFGALRPIGIIAGLVIAPVSSLFMILSLAALAASFLPWPIWDGLDLALGYLYRFLEFLVSHASRVPGLTFSGALPVLAVSILFSLLILLIHRRDQAYRSSIASFD